MKIVINSSIMSSLVELPSSIKTELVIKCIVNICDSCGNTMRQLFGGIGLDLFELFVKHS